MNRKDRLSSTGLKNGSRRHFLQTGGKAAAGSLLATMAVPHVHAAEDNTIRLALIGCGGRGSGAAVNSGQIITWDQVMKSDFQWCPYIDRMTPDSPPPVQADERGHYPVPVPGVWKEV